MARRRTFSNQAFGILQALKVGSHSGDLLPLICSQLRLVVEYGQAHEKRSHRTATNHHGNSLLSPDAPKVGIVLIHWNPSSANDIAGVNTPWNRTSTCCTD